MLLLVILLSLPLSPRLSLTLKNKKTAFVCGTLAPLTAAASLSTCTL